MSARMATGMVSAFIVMSISFPIRNSRNVDLVQVIVLSAKVSMFVLFAKAISLTMKMGVAQKYVEMVFE